MGEGNGFFNILLWPAVERLLRPQPGEQLLDVACGNGLTSRRLATAKARVTAFDGSAAMIAIAAGHASSLNIEYQVVDATDREALLGLGAGAFDGLEGQFTIILANAQHVKNVPGRKTDTKHSEWIAELLQHGLLRSTAK